MEGKNKLNKASKSYLKGLVLVVALVSNNAGAYALEIGESPLLDSLIPQLAQRSNR